MKTIQIPIPTGGVNHTDLPMNLEDTQSVAVVGLQTISGVLETIRGIEYWSTPSYGSDPIDDLVAYHKSDGTSHYVFTSGGAIYKQPGPNMPYTNIGSMATGAGKVRLLQFGDMVIALQSGWKPRVWDGTNFWQLGINPPLFAPTLASAGASDGTTRSFVYTYYNPTLDIESDPSPALNVDGTASFSIGVTASSDPQVTKIRIYRSGLGFATPRLAVETTNATGNVTVSDSDSVVATKQEVRYDRTIAPTTVADGTVFNNRLFLWDENGSTIYISNDGEPAYFPAIPMLDSEDNASGGQLEIERGDGDAIMSAVPWGSSLVVFKTRRAFRVQEAEIGFFTYTRMPVDGCIAPRSAALTAGGIVWLSSHGFMLLDFDEAQSAIGYPILADTAQIVDAEFTVGVASRDTYVVTIKMGPISYGTFMWSPNYGWTGSHSVAASVWYEDIGGELLFGDVTAKVMGRWYIHTIGPVNMEPVDWFSFLWKTKAFDFAEPTRYKRIRTLWVYATSLAGLATQPQVTLRTYDGFGTELSMDDVVINEKGVMRIDADIDVTGMLIQFEIMGSTSVPIRINGLAADVELGATIHE